MTDKAIASPPASLRSRLAAMIYELLLVVAVIFIASFIFIRLTGDAQNGGKQIAFQLFLLGVLFAYFSTFWLRSGQTLAMKTWRIKLVDRDDALITLKHAALRFVLALLGLALGGVTIIWALFDADRQFLHDRLARTRLIYFVK
ncbi:MAG: RDD family protein [Thiobacillus sp.]